ncbi:MAG: transposase, partial [Rubrobacter sp.]
MRVAVPRKGRALPGGVRPVILADRGFHRAGFIAWLERHRLDYVVRLKKGACITEGDGSRWKLGEEALKLGELRFAVGVRYGLYIRSNLSNGDGLLSVGKRQKLLGGSRLLAAFADPTTRRHAAGY